MSDLFEKEEASAGKKVLRPHQAKAIDLLRSAFGGGLRRVIIQAPTAFGKTLTATHIIQMARAKGNRVIFTVPMISLIGQTVKAFEAEGLCDIGVMQASHPRTDPLAGVQVASVQTLARRDIPEAAMVVVDECHIRSAVIDSLMDERPDVFFVGLSATPWSKGLGLRWQSMVSPVRISELIDLGLLSRFVVYAPDVPDLSRVKVERGDYAEAALAEVMGGASLVGHVVETWLERGENRPTLAFGVNRAHAKNLMEQFQSAGVATAYVDGFTDTVERDRIRRQFIDGEFKVIASVRTMTTGVDLPVSCICDCAPTKSESLHVQKIGRGLRVNPGTEDLVVFDHAGNSLRLGLVTDIHHEALDATKPGRRSTGGRDEKPAEALPKPCVKCEVLFTGRMCPACGHERRPAHGVETADGVLVQFSGAKRGVSAADKARFYGMALWLDAERGKGGRLAKGLFKGRFNEWPERVPVAAIPPDQAFLNYERSSRIRYAKSMAKKGAAR